MPSRKDIKRYAQRGLNEAAEIKKKFNIEVKKPKGITQRGADLRINQKAAEAYEALFEQAFGKHIHAWASPRAVYCYMHCLGPKSALRAAEIFAEAGLPVTLGLLEDGTARSNIVKADRAKIDKNTLIIIRPRDWPTDWRERLEFSKPGTARLSRLDEIKIALNHKSAPHLPRLIKRSDTTAEQANQATQQPAAPAPAEPKMKAATSIEQVAANIRISEPTPSDRSPLDTLFPSL